MKAYPEKLHEALTASEQGDYWATELLRAWLDMKMDATPTAVRDKFRRSGAYDSSPYRAIIVHETNLPVGEIDSEHYVQSYAATEVTWTDDIDKSMVFETEREIELCLESLGRMGIHGQVARRI